MADFLFTAIAAGSANIHEPVPDDGADALLTETAEGSTVHHQDPSLFGVLNGTVWVSIAMIVFIAIVVWKGGVKAITGMLDRQIADVRKQLDDAKALRAEAEALRDEYARKIADAEKTAADMAANAEHEAHAIVDQARADAAELVTRRARMAEDKIAAAERAALAEVRAKTATAAAAAAATLIAERHSADADKALVDKAIAGIGRTH